MANALLAYTGCILYRRKTLGQASHVVYTANQKTTGTVCHSHSVAAKCARSLGNAARTAESTRAGNASRPSGIAFGKHNALQVRRKRLQREAGADVDGRVTRETTRPGPKQNFIYL